MQSYKLCYGIEEFQVNSTAPMTFGQLRRDYNAKAALGYGDNVRMLLNGVEMPDDAIAPNNSRIVVETRANQKAEVVAA